MIRNVNTKGPYKLIVEFDTSDERDAILEKLSDSIKKKLVEETAKKP